MLRRTADGRRSIMAGVGLALVLLAGAAGCGDPLADKLESSGRQPFSDDDPPIAGVGASTTTTAPVDAAAMARWTFVTEANQMCERQGTAVGSGLLNNLGTTDTREAFEAIIGTYETLGALMAGLTPPPGDEAVVAELVGGYNHIVALVRPVLDAGGMFPTQAALDAWKGEFQAAVTTHAARLDAYGLGSCS